MARGRLGVLTSLLASALVGCAASSGDPQSEPDGGASPARPGEDDDAASATEPEPSSASDSGRAPVDAGPLGPENPERDAGGCEPEASCEPEIEREAGVPLDASSGGPIVPLEDASLPATADAGDAPSARDSGGEALPRDAGSSLPTSSDAGPLELGLLGCTAVPGERPPSTGAGSAEVAALVLEPAERNQPLSGSLRFRNLDGEAANLVVQVNGALEHYLCPLSPQQLMTGQATLEALAPGPQFPEEAQILYVGVQDLAGKTSAYLVGTLQVGDSPDISVCRLARPFQMMGRIPSASTDFYLETNGISSEYRLEGAEGSEMTIVGATRVSLDMGNCSHLYLSADAEGLLPVGWDNCLVVEYRATTGGPVLNAWSYCSSDTATVYSVTTGEPLAEPVAPTLVGTVLDPEVPNPGSQFGHEPWAIDLMTEVASETNRFELTLLILDYGSVGSTTDIWASLEVP